MKKKIIPLILFICLFFTKTTIGQTYNIVLSSHKNENIAIKQVNKLKASGYTESAVLFSPVEKRYRVSVNSFDSKTDALRNLKILKSKYNDAWIFETSPYEMNENLLSNVEAINKLKLEFDNQKTQINDVFRELEVFRDELTNIEFNFNTNKDEKGRIISELQKKVDSLTFKLNSINNNIDKFDNKFVNRNDTILYSWESVKSKFDFGNPKLSFNGGIFQSNIISPLSTELHDYFHIEDNTDSRTFFGFNIGAFYNFSNSWSSGLDLNFYLYNKSYYLFPLATIKYSKQIAYTPFKINGSLGLGTDVLFHEDNATTVGHFLIVQPGMEIVAGINKRLSCFGGSYYNLSYPISSNIYKGSSIHHFNYKIGFLLHLN